MPKAARTADPLVGEVSANKRARMSSSSSPLVHQLSIHLSPQHLEESGDAVTQHQDSPYNVFPLLSPMNNPQPCVTSPSGLLSPDLTACPSSRPDKVSQEKDHATDFAGSVSGLSPQVVLDKDTNLLEGKEVMDTDDESVGDVRQNDGSPCGRDASKEKPSGQKTGQRVLESDVVRKGRQLASGEEPESATRPEVSELRSEEVTENGKENEGPAIPAVTGYVTLAARNGDSLLQGVLPPVLSPHQGAALNTCFPASDGNWYQVISASLPPILSTQSLALDKGNKAPAGSSSPSAQCGKESSAALHPLSLLSSLSLPTSAAAALTTTTSTSASIVAPLPTPSPSPDPLFSLLQQYSAGTACGTNLQTSLSALHLPLNLASAAVAAAASGCPATHVSPRYLYATNPRTGQLLILSSVGELAGGDQPLQLQPQLPLQPVMQLQQQQLKMQEKAWQSPLRLKQCPNPLVSTSTSTGLVAAKHATKPVSVVSKLLQNKLSSSLKHDENTPSVAAARNLLALATPAHTLSAVQNGVPSPLHHTSSDVKPGEEPIRENHNMKERRRRARIKDACDLMRQLVPGMSEKTDKATVFEFSARYIHFLKNFVGTQHDKDFLIKYSPY